MNVRTLFRSRMLLCASLVRRAGLWLLLSLMMAAQACAGITVEDDEGVAVTVLSPASRIISLSPHATELLYAIGAGDKIVGVTSFSDYPEEAKKLPVIGDYHQIDLERLLMLKPDLVVFWSGGSPPRQVEKLRRMGIAVFSSNPKSLADIPSDMKRLGVLAGTRDVAEKVAASWNARLVALRRQYAHRDAIRVFYQVNERPLFTLGGNHIVNEAISLCGGKNIFSGTSVKAPHVGVEAVLAANPEVIIGMDISENARSVWRQYRRLDALRYGNLFDIDPAWLGRPGPRMILGVEKMCRVLDVARQHRDKPR